MSEPHTADLGTRYRYRQEGAALEKERIIELLEPLAQHEDYCKDGCYPEDCSAPSYQYAIDLIKGEQN